MSDFPARAFKWTEILSLIIENSLHKRRLLKEDLDQLRQYAIKKYKANPQIEERFIEYFTGQEEMFAILVKLFGEP